MASPMRAMRPRLLNMIQVQSLLKTMAYGSCGRWSEDLAMRPPFVRSLGGVADESQTADFSVKEGWDRARSRKLLAGWTVERERPCRLACLALQFVSHRLGLVTRLMMKRPAQFAYQAPLACFGRPAELAQLVESIHAILATPITLNTSEEPPDRCLLFAPATRLAVLCCPRGCPPVSGRA